MQRRNFLKGAFGAWAGITTFFSYKYFTQEKTQMLPVRQKIVKRRSPDNIKFYHIEIPIAI